MKVGDLVCFNSAGQRKTSLGIVLAYESTPAADDWERDKYGREFIPILQIQWVTPPKLSPQTYNGEAHVVPWRDRHKLATWYPNIGWFEVVKADK